MERESRTVTVVIAGAVLGGLAGYFFLSGQGRRLRRQLEPALEDFARELASFRGTIQKALDVATESWGALSDLSGSERGSRQSNVH